MTITLQIDGSEVRVPGGATVLDAINASGTYISQLCKDPDMDAIGACRTCLVEIDGMRGLPASCSVPAADGMEVWTATDRARQVRTTVLELTSAMVGANGNGDNGHRELSLAAREHGIDAPRWAGREREPVDASNPVFDIAMDDCILCGRCAQACQDGHQFIGAIDFLGTGRTGRIGTFMDRPLVESVCTTCGQCLSVCPTGAIEVKAPPAEAVKSVTTTCPYCGVGCGIRAGVDETDRIIEMLDDPDNQSSLGMLCVKGRFGYTFVHHEDRLTSPLVRREDQLIPVSWDEALDYVAERLSEYTGDEFATLCSAKATNEDGYVQQKFARVVMQSNNIDHCTRLCHSPSVEAMLASLGSGATSNSYIDYEEAGCLVIIGSDANANHPVAAARMRRPAGSASSSASTAAISPDISTCTARMPRCVTSCGSRAGSTPWCSASPRSWASSSRHTEPRGARARSESCSISSSSARSRWRSACAPTPTSARARSRWPTPR